MTDRATTVAIEAACLNPHCTSGELRADAYLFCATCCKAYGMREPRPPTSDQIGRARGILASVRARIEQARPGALGCTDTKFASDDLQKVAWLLEGWE